MAAISSPVPSTLYNRRRRVRHKIQTPAYATLPAQSPSMLDLHEIVDISEDGVAIQCHSPLEVEQSLDLWLDLAECPNPILTTGRVVWVNQTGRAGFQFSTLPSESQSRLREWLFVNVMAGVANSEIELPASLVPTIHDTPRPSYTDTLEAVTAVQRQVQALGADFAGALQLVAERAQVLVRATGAAIALADNEPGVMVCRASSGPDAPPIGARLQVGSGFSGECVRTGLLLRSNDTELDPRVDRETCRALGIRSVLAAPIRAGERPVGLIEAFAPAPDAFSEADERVLLKFADTVLEAASRAARSEDLPTIADAAPDSFTTPQGSVLFATADKDPGDKNAQTDATPSLSLPRSYLALLTLAAAAISLSIGWLTAPWIQATAGPWIKGKIRSPQHTELQTVLASSRAPNASPNSPSSIGTATLDQLRQIANRDDAEAEYALGLRYAAGDGVRSDEKEAVKWFMKAANLGSVPAQSKLGSFYYSGRGVAPDPRNAYFWMTVARLNGDDPSKTLAPFVRARLTRSQVADTEEQASRWLQEHPVASRPSTQAKSSPHQ